MILELVAAGGGLVLVGGAAGLFALLAVGSRPDDRDTFQPAELAALHRTSAGPPWPVPGSQAACPNPDCHGRRCADWRRARTPCGEPELPARVPTFRAEPLPPREGRHSSSAAVVRWLAGPWWQAPLPVRLRRQLARMAGTGRVPVQLGRPRGRLP